jgi:hypothetical protein
VAGDSRSLELNAVRALAVFAASALVFGSLGCRDAEDRSFAEFQARGHVAMGVDQYTSWHVFESLPEGGRIALERDEADPAGVTRIREHMRHIAGAFARGDFRIPGFVHARDVPGTKVMSARQNLIHYSNDTLPRGAELRIVTGDSAAVEAIHSFLAFQRHDHRTGAIQ